MSTATAVEVRSWMHQGTQLFLQTLQGVDDADLDGSTSLPGWTRRHLIAHVHYNAEALRRLLHWARTGERTPMYESAEQRSSEIEAGAELPADELRQLVQQSAEALSSDVDTMPAEAWDEEVVTAQGRTVPAREVLWMRTREVTVHAVDLDVDVTFRDLPDELNAALVADVVRKRCNSGEAADLAAWLTGRADQAPDLGPWL